MTVKCKNSIEYKALQRIKKIHGNVVLRQDLTDLGSYRQVSRVFKKLIDANKIIKIGAGIYAKAYFSKTLNKPLVQGTFGHICKEALTRKGVQWESGTAEQAYNAGLSTQVPARTVVRLKSRFRGILSDGRRKLIIEKRINAR